MGMIISILRWYSAVCFHTSVGFLLVYLIWWAMRRPLLVNKQRRSALFVLFMRNKKINYLIKMKRLKLLVVLLCLWQWGIPLAAQSVTITKELEVTPLASAIAMFKNQFGKWEKPDLDDTFPYAVIRMRLEGNEIEVKKAKERLTLYMGQLTTIVDRYVESSNEILFLVPARRPSIYIDCGDGCEQVLLIENQQLRSNGVYYCKVHFQQSKEVVALEEEIAVLKQRLELLESVDATKKETQEDVSNNLQFNVNGISFTMVKVNGGKVNGGEVNGGEVNLFPGQKIDPVVLSEHFPDYFIGQTEVTQELWNAVMGYNNSEFPYSLQQPMETINYYEVITFIYRLCQLTGENFDIPSRAEWIHAALEGTTQNYLYSGSNDLYSVGWCRVNAISSRPVKTRTPNNLGIYDMTGNVAELCYDNNRYYALGGSWKSTMDECQVLADQKSIKPNEASSSIGLRLVLHPKQSQKNDNLHIRHLGDSSCVFQIGEVSFNLRYVEEGTFMMGSSKDRSAQPLHEVTLSNYYIGETEVTEQLWYTIMERNPPKAPFPLPKLEINYYDCLRFIIRLNAVTGKCFRLPTEAEWEYAARGGKKNKDYKYAGSNILDNVAWYYNNSFNKTHPVKLKQANELGIYDMIGNAWEWCQDDSPLHEKKHVIRGGSFLSSNPSCTTRSSRSPELANCDIGFRLVLSIDDEFDE